MTVAPLTILRRDRFEYLAHLATEMEVKLSNRILACAAKLVDYFAHWGKWKKRAQRTEWIYQPLRQIREDLMGEHGLYTLRRAIAFLLDTGLLCRRRNPGNGQDRTWQYKIELPTSEIESSKFEIEPSKSQTGQFHRYTNIDSPTAIKSSSIAAGGVEMSGERGFPESGEDISEGGNSGEQPKEKSEDIEEKTVTGQGDSSAAADELFEKIEGIGITINAQIRRAVISASVATIENAIALTKSRRRELKNPAGFLVRAIQEKWQPDIREPEVHPVVMASNSAKPEELRSRYAAIEEEQNSPEWQSGREQFLAAMEKIKSRCLEKRI